MNPKIRALVYIVCATVLFGVLVYASTGLPAFGSFSGAYTDMLLQVASAERHIDNIPTAVNFDYRGFDTIGEEFIFFTSVAGVLFMFSKLLGAAAEQPEPMEQAPHRHPSGANIWILAGLTAFIAAFGMDLGAHGQLTPGGGFQGGAVFGSAMACIYLGFGIEAMVRVANKEIFDRLEALGAFSFVALGVAGAFAAGAFLKNVLPLGTTGATVSSGNVYFISCAVFVEIACGFSILALVFLKQLQEVEESEE